VATLNEVKPKLVVASCPHCMNSIGKEYKQIGGDYKVIHHTESLEMLVSQKRLDSSPSEATITYHDPCYLGRHNGVYDAPRSLLHILGNEMVELDRTRENAFCCGAGGAQFWKEEEAGDERISDNRFREAEHTLASAAGEKVLAVGCPFCKSMLGSTPLKGESEIVIKDVAELLLEGVRRKKGLGALSSPVESGSVAVVTEPADSVGSVPAAVAGVEAVSTAPVVAEPLPVVEPSSAGSTKTPVGRKKWQPKAASPKMEDTASTVSVSQPALEVAAPAALPVASLPERKKWQPKGPVAAAVEPVSAQEGSAGAVARPEEGVVADSAAAAEASAAPERKKWQPKKAGPAGS
jgi:hypothetical protein